MTRPFRLGMTSVRASGVDLGTESFGRAGDPLVLLAGGTTMLSWPDTLCERLASGGRHVVRYDLRDSGASTTLDPQIRPTTCATSPPTRPRWSRCSVPRSPISAESASAGWSLRSLRWTTRTGSPP